MHVSAAQAKAATAAIYDHALSVGFSRGFEVSAGIMVLALIVTLAFIRVTREDLAGAQAVMNVQGGDPVTRKRSRSIRVIRTQAMAGGISRRPSCSA